VCTDCGKGTLVSNSVELSHIPGRGSNTALHADAGESQEQNSRPSSIETTLPYQRDARMEKAEDC